MGPVVFVCRIGHGTERGKFLIQRGWGLNIIAQVIRYM